MSPARNTLPDVRIVEFASCWTSVVIGSTFSPTRQWVKDLLRRLLALLCGAANMCQAQASLTQVGDAAKISPFAALKARTLMQGRLPCLGCHTLDAQAEGGRVGPELGPVAERRSAAYIARIIDDPQGTVPGTSMPRTPMSPDLRVLVIAYLTRSSTARVPPPAAAASGAAGQRHGAARDAALLYGRFCAPCHGTRGGGDGPNAPNLSVRPLAHRDPRLMSARTDDRLFDAIYDGGYPLGRSAAMPAFGATLSRDEIWSLVRYLRTLCRCVAPAWSTDGERFLPRQRPSER